MNNPYATAAGGYASNPSEFANHVGTLQQGYIDQNTWRQRLNNRVGQSNAYGSSSFVENPDGTTTYHKSLSPEQEVLRLQEQSLDLNRLGLANEKIWGAKDALSDPLSYDSLPEVSGDYLGRRDEIADGLYDSYSQDIMRDFGRVEDDLRQSLADRGIGAGNERGTRELGSIYDSLARSLVDARARATTTAGEEVERDFDIATQNRARALGELESLRYSELNELQSLMGIAPSGERGFSIDPYSTIDVDLPDVTGLASGVNNQLWQSAEGALDRENALRLAEISGQFGLSVAGLNADAAASRLSSQLASNAALQNSSQQFQLDLLNAQDRITDGNRPSGFEGFIGAVGPGLSQGIGAAVGNNLFG